ncbi:hypothetical protein BRE01_29900 [Brevibacillus reuszeri]|uniref:Group-specific protein n=1 Tax=Brevibacillus reuszeri TaxID=54915 RepID=A0A0K9YKQ3_9BACL|nr:Imm47 family immunity protein [Brevibacillus reuszeri]KNB68770.1 hypothetical protein ADS79_32955 [Brevibacillus reuszeri]MED1859070.1 Imm47 family immunity protein [Brevibacillus reuszeri]GED69288.1 hypothetical protein BRE01_29900 [Brevibacillus reuszeri]
MTTVQNVWNSSWFGEKPTSTVAELTQKLREAMTEKEMLFLLIELYKAGDFTQKPLLIQLMNHTKDEAILNLCIRLFFSICTHEDVRETNNLRFLQDASEFIVNTFASAAPTSLSPEVIPYLLALLEEWDDIPDTSVIIRDSIDSFLSFENQYGEEATIEQIAECFLDFGDENEGEMYYFDQKPAFPGDLTKPLIHRVFIAANNEERLQMEVIPSLLSIWSGKKVPGEYDTVITASNYQSFISYVEGLANQSWEKGRKYFYGHPL